MKKLHTLRLTTAAAAACLAAGAQAQAMAWDPSWAFSGFGTLGYAKTSTDQGQLINPGQAGGTTSDGSIGMDTLLGAQLNARANPVFSATLQGVSQRNGKGNFQPSVEWAFVKAQVVPDLGIRVGRIGTPYFMVSDYRHVNYSNLWVRPPLEVYNQIPVNNFDGADAIYQHTLGSATLTAQVYGGKCDGYVNKTPAHVKNLMGMALTAEFDDGITLRAGRTIAKMTFTSPRIELLEATLAKTPFSSIADELSGHHVSFTSFSAALDHENWVGSIEYTLRRAQTFVADTTGWEATGGYRFGKFTPYLVASRIKIDNPNVVNTIPAGVPKLAPLSGAVDAVLRQGNIAQHSQAVGLRWDACKNIALKAQYDRIKVGDGTGTFQSSTPAISHSSVNVVSASVDFLF